MTSARYIIGIDEAGRGPVAGPVSVGGVCIKSKDFPKLKEIFLPIKGKDSKKIPEKKRGEWFDVIEKLMKEGVLSFSVSMTGASTIDDKGIVFSIRQSMRQVLTRLCKNPSECQIKLDGGLYAPEVFENQETIIKGDEKELIISLASICAKVVRDRKMIENDIEYPVYGFARHKGYGTKAHYEAIKNNGICKEHRMSFLINRFS